MDRQTFILELRNIISDFLKQQELDLVDLIYRYEARNLVLRILVDRPHGGISLDECAYLNQKISQLLDEKNILPTSYLLEVSSPGVDRPLTKRSDFLRCLNKKVRFFLREPIKQKIELEGKIMGVDDDLVCIKIAGENLEIPLSKINKAKQLIDN